MQHEIQVVHSAWVKLVQSFSYSYSTMCNKKLLISGTNTELQIQREAIICEALQ